METSSSQFIDILPICRNYEIYLNKITGCVIILGHIPAVVVMFGVMVDVKYSVGTKR